MNFEDKNILVIGGSSGIGLALVKQLANKGAKVYNASRHPSAEWTDGVTHIELDVLGDTSSLASQLPETLHGLVYCPGSITLKPFTRLTKDDFFNDFRINVIGASEVIQQAFKPLKNAGKASIILFSTIAAKTGMAYHASIAAAKGGVEGLAVSLAAEFAPLHIRVNVIALSLTDTPLAAHLLSTPEKKEASAKRHPLGKYGNAGEIASAARFLLSADSSWITGQVIGIDGGLSKLRSL